MSEQIENQSYNNKKYWKSLDEKYQTEEWRKVAENEFLNSPYASESEDGTTRRDFLKLMGASIALATTSCVRHPVEHIIPYSTAPVELTPGVANYYASSWVHAGQGYGFVVKTREGRPIKLEGNPAHPVNGGGLSAIAQAQVLGLYDPDRLQYPAKKNASGFDKISWDQLDDEVQKALKRSGVVVLTSSLGSPTTNQLIDDFIKAFGGKHVVWDPLGADDVMEGQDASYGQSILPRYRFDKAKMIVSIGCDFLGTWISPVEHAKDFSKNRKANAQMNRLVVFESLMSLTGANADTRIMVRPSDLDSIVLGLLYEILVVQKNSRYASDSQVAKALSGYSDVAAKIGIEKELFSEIAKDLWKHRGQSLVVTGGLATRTDNSHSLQVAVNFLNTVLENEGATVDALSVPFKSYQGSYKAIFNLMKDMSEGKVKALVINNLNPVYAMPGFSDALSKVPLVIYMGDRIDETAKMANYLAPDHHHLENWGDSEIQKGVYAIQQPTIRPLFDTRSMQLSMISWAYQAGVGPDRLQKSDSWLDYLKNFWKSKQSEAGFVGSFEDFWIHFLKTGVIDTSNRGGKRNSPATARKFQISALSKLEKSKTSDLELVLYPTVGHLDGTFANMAWIQEFPDPVTKATWGSYVTVSPEKAKELGLRNDDVVELKLANKSVIVPTLIQPGQHKNVLGLAVGKGRTDAGSVGSNVGVNAFTLSNAGVFSGIQVTLLKTDQIDPVANVQGHNSMEGRQIVVQATLKEYLEKNDAHIHKHDVFSIWPKFEYKGYRWGMSIDLSTCIGCAACMIACQSENNIPSVGKRFVLEGREMHWMRIDRYYVGEENDAQAVFQPMLCQHCENAPCETVCPVLATTHDEEGLNQMVYNRCVGTRYCSNNCPYKVRRFNWFSYDSFKKPMNLVLNPDVTVRSRGVMEKCTFCIQRIHTAKNEAKDKGTTVKDGDFQVACEQSCPTKAITFGNMNDPESAVSKAFKEQNTYGVLEEFNTVPSVRYRSKIRNADKIKQDSHGGGGHA